MPTRLILLILFCACTACDKNVYEARNPKPLRPVDGTAPAVSLQWDVQA